MAEIVIKKPKLRIYYKNNSAEIPIGLLKSKSQYVPINNIILKNNIRYSTYRLDQVLKKQDVIIPYSHRINHNSGEILTGYDKKLAFDNTFIFSEFQKLISIRNTLFKQNSLGYGNRIDYQSIVATFTGRNTYNIVNYHSESNNIRYRVNNDCGFLSIIHNNIETILICIVFKNTLETLEYLAYSYFLNLPLDPKFVEVWIDSKFDTKFTQHSGLRSMYRKNIKPGLADYKIVYKENIISELYSMPKLPKFKTPVEYSKVIESIGDAYCNYIINDGILPKVEDEDYVEELYNDEEEEEEDDNDNFSEEEVDEIRLANEEATHVGTITYTAGIITTS